MRTFRGPSDRVRTCGLMVPNGSYGRFSRSSPLVFRPAVRCNAVVARYAEFLSGTVRKCVLRCPISDCGCDCESVFWVLWNVLRKYRQIDKGANCSNPHQQLVRNSINKTKDNKLKPFGTHGKGGLTHRVKPPCCLFQEIRQVLFILLVGAVCLPVFLDDIHKRFDV